MSSLSPGELEARLLRLERHNAILRRVLALALLVAAVPLLAAYVPANDKIEASEFIVRDKSGAARARIYIDEQGKTRLMLKDRDGKSTVMLSSGDGAAMSLGDKEGKSNVVLSSGSAAKGILVLESDGKPKAVLSKPKGFDAMDPLDIQDPWASPD
jgi:hypothetical protein